MYIQKATRAGSTRHAAPGDSSLLSIEIKRPTRNDVLVSLLPVWWKIFSLTSSVMLRKRSIFTERTNDQANFHF